MVATVERVPDRTAQYVNERIRRQTEASIAYYSAHRDQISERLRELDAEWDIERAIEAEAGGVVVASLVMGMTVSRKWLALPVFAAGMLLLHNLHGFYPWLPLLRRMGFRTQDEINEERYALKRARGDFNGLEKATDMVDRFDQAFAAADPHS